MIWNGNTIRGRAKSPPWVVRLHTTIIRDISIPCGKAAPTSCTMLPDLGNLRLYGHHDSRGSSISQVSVHFSYM